MATQWVPVVHGLDPRPPEDRSDSKDLLAVLESSVEELVKEFVTSPDEPIKDTSLAYRQVLISLERFLSYGLVPLIGSPEDGKDGHQTQDDALWSMFRQARVEGGLEECMKLEQLISDVDNTTIPPICVRYGWGWGRLGIIQGLNRRLLSRLLDAVVADAPLLRHSYEPKAPMLQPEYQHRLCAQVAALNGVMFSLTHWCHVVLGLLPGLSCSTSGRGGSSGLNEEAIADELHFKHGAISAVTYLVQALPVTNVRIQCREDHTIKLSATPPSPSDSTSSSSSNTRMVAVWQFEVLYYDLAFSVSVDGQDVPSYPWTRYSANGRQVEGAVEVVDHHHHHKKDPPSQQKDPSQSSTPVVALRWDNTYSYRRPKDLRYRVALVTHDAYQAAQISAYESLSSAIWNCLAFHNEPQDMATTNGAGGPLPGRSPPPAQRRSSILSLLSRSDWDTGEDGLGISNYFMSTGGDGSPSTSAPTPQSVGLELRATSNCQMCFKDFGFFRRQHRCRMCNGSFCLPCSRHRVDLGPDRLSQRVCDRCYIRQVDEKAPTPRPTTSTNPPGNTRNPSTSQSNLLAVSPPAPTLPLPYMNPTSPPLQPDPPCTPPTSTTTTSSKTPYEQLQDDPEIQKYFKMVGFGVPRSAVAQKMSQDNVPESKIRIFLQADEDPPTTPPRSSTLSVPSSIASSPSSQRSSGGTNTKHKSLNVKLKPVHWEVLSGDRAEKSVFGRRSSVGRNLSRQLEKMEVQELAQYFAAKAEKSPSSTSLPVTKAKGHRPTASVLDGRRLNNVGIVYTFFRKAFKGPDDIIVTILTLNRERIPPERLHSLLEVLPTSDEAKKLLSYRGELSELSDAEVFMRSVTRIPRMAEKVRAFMFYCSLREVTAGLEQKLDTLLRTCADIMRSDRLVRALEVLLVIGNTLNAYSDSATGQGEGFTIDSLLKIMLTRSTTGSLTLLDYFVRNEAERGEGDVLSLIDDLPSIQLATTLPDVSVLIKDVRAWVREFEKVDNECQQEQAELEAVRQARRERREARRRALEEKRRKEEEEERQKQERLERQARWEEDLRLLREGRGMEMEDSRRGGELFAWWLSELEGRARAKEEGVDEEEAKYLLEAIKLLGLPPVPREIGGLLVEGEGTTEGIRRLNYELGGMSETDLDQQRLLRLISRWLIMHSRCKRTLSLLPPPPVPVEPTALNATTSSFSTPTSSTGGGDITQPDPRRALLDAITKRSPSPRPPPPPSPSEASQPHSPSPPVSPLPKPPIDPRTALLSAITNSASSRKKSGTPPRVGGGGYRTPPLPLRPPKEEVSNGAPQQNGRISSTSAPGSSSSSPCPTPTSRAALMSAIVNSRKTPPPGENGGSSPNDNRNALLASIRMGKTTSSQDTSGGSNSSSDGRNALLATIRRGKTPPPGEASDGGSSEGGRNALLDSIRMGKRSNGGNPITRGLKVQVPDGEDWLERDDGPDEGIKMDFEKERQIFANQMGRFVETTRYRAKELREKSQQLEDKSRELFIYFGEEPKAASSSRIFSTLWNFLCALRISKATYEKRYGPVVDPTELALAKGLPALVGQRLATIYGAGVVEAFHLRRGVVVTRLAWGAVAYLNPSALVGQGRRVRTKYGKGVVAGVQKIVGTYEVKLDWGATLYTQPQEIHALQHIL